MNRFMQFVLFVVVGKLIEHALLGWGDDLIADALGIHAPTWKEIANAPWQWGIPLVIALVLYGMYQVVTQPGRLSNWWKDRFSSEMYPLSEAGLRLYEVSRHSFLAKFVEKYFNDDGAEETLLSVFAAYVANADIPVFGKHPPSTKFEKIDKHLLKSSRIVERGNELRYHGAKRPEFVELSIRRKDFREALKEVKANSKALEPNVRGE